ncbi:MAG TPA: glycosyl hydrolase [Thermoanaerobaculia bacterium]|nr:glycosyl hydrolase [Thermoanaerobaculia bacterium]
MRRLVPVPLVLLLLLFLLGLDAPVRAADDEKPPVDPALFEELSYRSIGPSRGGRVTAVAGVRQEPFTFYMGSTGGGVWRTTNAGTTWENVSDDDLGVGSIGAVAVAPSDPNVIWIGTGSACPRGNVSIGDGVYRSTDGAKSFSHVGLERAGLVGRIAVHPADPDTAWVAALGQAFGPNPERGVYRTRDGGASWEHVLAVSDTAGAVDLSLDASNPRVLYAAIWRMERKPWTLIDGGEESGLYKSVDGGDTWKRLEKDLPDGVLGRIGVSVSPVDPERVWALVTADQGRVTADQGREFADQGRGGLFRSDDGGESWRRTSTDRELQTRGWYYSHVLADPADRNTVWVMNVGFWRSIDGGTSFERVPTPHGDNHDLWIHPDHPEIMVEGNDGGATVSLDGGETWSTLHNQPTAEFYRVTVDNRFPYRVYGAQQDNTTISVPSVDEGGIAPEQSWYPVAGAESGHIAVDPRNPDIVYSGNYLGQIDRYDHATGYSRNVILYPQMQDGTAPEDLAYRFQWNAPILISRHDPDVVYHASNFVHRTRDGGKTWETISPDLTRDDAEKQQLPGGPVQHDHTGVEVYNTVFALAESPHAPGELWAGADDGLVHISRDGAATWSDVTPEEMPVDATINSIEPSPHAPGRVYVAAYRYRLDDYRPFVFRTDDWGQSWRAVSAGLPEDHPVRVVREDTGREGLLFAGTEFGMFVSFDGGARWQPFQLDLPVSPITDLVVHHDDLVVATQGRSFWILDDLTRLRQLEPGVVPEEVRLFEIADAVRVERRGAARGAILDLWLPAPAEPGGVIEIVDEQDRVAHTFEAAEEVEERPARSRRRGGGDGKQEVVLEQGMNRLTWDLTYPPPELVEGAVMSLAYTGGPFAAPGEYRARLRLVLEATEDRRDGDEGVAGANTADAGKVEDGGGTAYEATREVTAEQRFRVVADPRLGDVSQEDLEEQFRFALEVRDRLGFIHSKIRALRSAREQVESILERAAEVEIAEAEREALEQAGKDFVAATRAAEEKLIQTRNEVGQDPINFPPKIDDQFAYLYSHVVSSLGRPTAGTYRRWNDLQAELEPLIAEAVRVLETELPDLDARILELGLGGVIVPGLP